MTAKRRLTYDVGTCFRHSPDEYQLFKQRHNILRLVFFFSYHFCAFLKLFIIFADDSWVIQTL